MKIKTKSHFLASCGLFSIFAVLLTAGGCLNGYSNESLYRNDISTIYVEMFDTSSYRRGVEADFTDALCKRIELETPYKIVSDKNRADSIISGNIAITNSTLSLERQTGRALENELEVSADVSWKNLRTGELLMENESATAAVAYSKLLNQGENYSTVQAANRLAKKVVELMQNDW